MEETKANDKKLYENTFFMRKDGKDGSLSRIGGGVETQKKGNVKKGKKTTAVAATATEPTIDMLKTATLSRIFLMFRNTCLA